MAENISPSGAATGVVVASPQKENPNYFRHWIRDAALTMEVVFHLWLRAESQSEKALWEQKLKEYIYFSRQNQLAQTITGLGEPIFEADGKPFWGPWGRPQNDGPAQRAIALIQLAEVLLDRGQHEFVSTWLYSGHLPASTIIKADLEYVSHHWQDASFDLWEEVKGDHFYTRMVQRKALLMGSRLAHRLNDPQASQWYAKQAQNLESKISQHWSRKQSQIHITLNRVEGIDYKDSGLDSAVILGALHGEFGSFFSVYDERVQTTFDKMVRKFSEIYEVNKKYPQFGVALGRYPEDKYAGTHFNGGNPWVLTTLAAAETCYKLAANYSKINLTRAQKWQRRGDQFVQRVQFHAYPDGSLSEQIQKETGFMTSARDLTWNYSAVLTAAWARQQSSLQIQKAKGDPQ